MKRSWKVIGIVTIVALVSMFAVSNAVYACQGNCHQGGQGQHQQHPATPQNNQNEGNMHGSGGGQHQGQGNGGSQHQGQGNGGGQHHGQGNGGSGQHQSGTMMQEAINKLPKQTIDKNEKAGIVQMREEEKLAKDVYLTLYKKWNLRIFSNIAKAEQTHTNAVKMLMQKYGIKDPVEATKDETGVFESKKLQEIYDKLVQKGSTSLLEALKVGAMVEELDIKDLQEHLKNTDNKDIQMVYKNLMKASRNHLRAFIKLIKREGGTYTPQYLSLEEFNQIINSPNERGMLQ